MSKERSDVAKRPLDRRVGDAVCRRCGGKMKPSQAIGQTWTGLPDFPGGDVVTLSPGGPGRLIDCLKCEKCGHSISSPNDQAQARAEADEGRCSESA